MTGSPDQSQPRATARPLICLAASGGGHVRQLLDLEPLWRDYPRFFVTEDTALGRSLAREHEVIFVPHFAIGQARLGAPLTMLRRAWTSLWRSLAVIRTRRPDVVITTGAGSQLFVVAWARLLGARIVLIDSFARFDGPSAFARLAGPLAHHRFAQSERAGAAWHGAKVHNPLRELDTSPPAKRPLLLATVGATLPFERLTRLVVEAKRRGWIEEEIVLQTGSGAASEIDVPGIKAVEELPYDEIQRLLAEARLVICHGGTGSIITALRQHCRVIVIARRFALGEHYDEHQQEIAESFAARGLVFMAHDEESLRRALLLARASAPRAVTTDYSALIEDLRAIIGPPSVPANR